MRKFISLFLCLFMAIGWASAQNISCSGVVISAEDGEPIIGASVMVNGTSTGTITDFDGNFSLSNLPTSSKKLTVSYIGMKTSEVELRSNMRIVLESASQELDEVMVVAYGTAKKESFTGSAEVIKAEKLASRPVANVTKALDGQVAGVQTTSGSGQPGSGVSVVVRGFGSINSSQEPLYVVDGVPFDGQINSINPNDIETMTVLKDASAGALYGSRGANGVVMITTKKGSNGKMKVNLKANWGIASRSIPEYETMDEKGYVETIFQSFKNENIANGMNPSTAGAAALEDMRSGAKKIFGNNEEYNPFNYSITDLIDPATGKVRSDATLKYSENWIDEAMANNPLRQEYQASFTGGKEKTNYMFSLGYLDEEGLLKTTGFKRYSGRVNVDSEVTDWLKAGGGLSYARNESNYAKEEDSSSSNVWYSAMLMAPIYPVYQKDANGNTIMDNTGNKSFDYGANRPAGANANWNTVATLYDDLMTEDSDNLSGRAFAELGNLKKGPLAGLKLSVNYGFDLINRIQTVYYNPNNGNAASIGGQTQKASTRTFSHTFNQILSYDRTFGDHHISALAGHEFYQYINRYLYASKSGFPFGGLTELDAASSLAGASSYENNYAVESVLSRFAYDYQDKYYLSASYRRDGSSRFNKENRWGNFWSVGANWRISQEDFMSSLDYINNLSAKASYGVQGNDALQDEKGNSVFYAWQSFYDLGNANAGMSGAVLSSLENTDLKWEKNANLNVGIDAKIFDRYSIGIEWYRRLTSDMLMSYPMPSSLGFDGYNKNIGEMVNSGFDITLGAAIFKDTKVKWNLTLMGSTVKNKVTKLADKPEIITGNYIIKEGETLNSFYTATSAGVDPATGKQLYWVWDENRDGTRSEKYVTSDMSKATNCRSIQGSRIPDLYGSIANDLRYKNFDLNILCTYSIGGKVYDNVYRTLKYGTYVGNSRSAHLARAWQNPGDITDIPKIEIGTNYIATDSDLVDASYFSIKNITLGYTMPTKWIKRAGFESLRLTATGDNLVMFTHLKGLNPQYNFKGSTSFGYVPTRTISFGIDLRF